MFFLNLSKKGLKTSFSLKNRKKMENISSIIAAVNPEQSYNFESKSDLADFKKLAKKDFSKAIEKAKPKPAEEHALYYDSPTESLEPLYFWILDFMNGQFGGNVEKLIDNFTSSPGSGHF